MKKNDENLVGFPLYMKPPNLQTETWHPDLTSPEAYSAIVWMDFERDLEQGGMVTL